MILITEIEIKNFRSIRKCNIKKIKDFNSFFGINNSGKSNILRALNLFFNNWTDNQELLDFDSDFHQSESKRKQEISISVTFELPENFKFKEKLKTVKKFILRGNKKTVTIKKVFGREYNFPERIYLNGSFVKENDVRNIERFLNLINFRYIPNRVLPVEILKEEGNALKKALSRKLNKRRIDKEKIQKATKELSKSISETSKSLIEPISKELRKISQNETKVELITPKSIEDLISTSGYFLNTENVRIEDTYQGSGIQSFLMFHTLHLIDKNYAQQFGWKQATVWAVEEPESSLHFDLEAQLANFLIQTVVNKDSRLQFFCTTHSTIFADNSQQSVLVEKESNETKCSLLSPNEIYKKIEQLKISRHTHPLLFFPRQNILLCEGKQDVSFINKILNLLNLSQSILHVTCLSDFEGKDNKGGVETVLKYIKEHKETIQTRYEIHKTKIIVLLDWDVSFDNKWKGIDDLNGVSVAQWSKSCVSEKTKNLKGIESLYPERFFKEAIKKDKFKEALSKDGKGNYAYPKGKKEKLNSLKDYLKEKVQSDLTRRDINHLEDFIKNVLDSK